MNKSKEIPQPQPFKLLKVACLLHNLVQIAGWGFQLFLVVKLAIDQNKDGSIIAKLMSDGGISGSQEIRESIYNNLYWIQLLQYLDLVFGVLGVTKTNPVLSFLQVTGRNFVVLGIFQWNLGSKLIYVAIIPWSFAELIRYPYYILTDLKVSSLLESVFKWLRLTAFIILYPVGLSGEILSLIESWNILIARDPYRLEMPNQYNFAFNILYCYYAFFVIGPIGMLFIYCTLLKARKRAYGTPKTDKIKTS